MIASWLLIRRYLSSPLSPTLSLQRPLNKLLSRTGLCALKKILSHPALAAMGTTMSATNGVRYFSP